jgi:hypothetical protein
MLCQLLRVETSRLLQEKTAVDEACQPVQTCVTCSMVFPAASNADAAGNTTGQRRIAALLHIHASLAFWCFEAFSLLRKHRKQCRHVLPAL